jgi:hypothetical protein
MAPQEKFDEIFSMSRDPTLAEVGGGHGQKGVDFQRYWAMVRIFELKQDCAADFLILFESLQDVAELDSETSPTKIDIYQVKKKDSGEWSFNSLTGLPKPGKQKTTPSLTAIESSFIGKLYKAGLAVQSLQSQVHFVSNAGCDLPLSTSGAASKLLSCLVSELDLAHTSALKDSLALLHSVPGEVPDLARLSLRKTTLHPDDPVRLALGAAFEYLNKSMPEHASQAKALVDSLFMQISMLGRQTEPVGSFSQLRKQRGFSMGEFDHALACLKKVPDLKAHFDVVLDGLVSEGLPVLRKLAVHIGATKYFSTLVAGTTIEDERALIDDCVMLAPKFIGSATLLPALEAEVTKLNVVHPSFKDTEILAYLIIQVTKYAAT